MSVRPSGPISHDPTVPVRPPRRRRVLALVLALVAVLVVPAHADPDTSRLQQLERELDELRGEADAREAALAAVDDRVARLRADRAEAAERLATIEAELSEVVEQYNEARVELDTVQEERSGTQQELDELQTDADVLADNVAGHARRLYRMGRSIEFATALSGDVTDAGFKSTSLRFVLNGERADLEQLTAVQDRLRGLEGRLAEQERAAAAASARVEDELRAVEATYDRYDDELTELTAVVQRGEREQAEEQAAFDEQRAAIATQVAAVDEERARIERLREQEAAAAAREAEQAAAAAAREAARPAPRASAPSTRAPSQQTSAPAAPAPSAPAPAPSARQSAQVAVDTALAQVGKPYVWGGNGPNGFDCSGLTSFAWRAAGVTIPRTSRAQFSGLRNVTRAQLQPGDLVFYNSPISHVAMYVGNDTIVEASRRGVPVRTARLSARNPVGYARP
jgi:peptidoglycan DL-endopeptidase CwlO